MVKRARMAYGTLCKPVFRAAGGVRGGAARWAAWAAVMAVTRRGCRGRRGCRAGRGWRAGRGRRGCHGDVAVVADDGF